MKRSNRKAITKQSQSKQMALPRATHEGKIGDIDCYVLDDGRCGLSLRRATGYLQGKSRGAGSGGLDRYIDRLAKQINHLHPVPVSTVEFVTPRGDIGQFIDDVSMAAICEAYVDGLVSGSLHPQTIPVAQRVYELQKSWTKIGLRAHILAAAGVAPVTAMQEIRSYSDRFFRQTPRDPEVVYTTELIDAIRRVYGMPRAPHESKRVPQWMASVFAKLYGKFIGKDAFALLQKKNPHPSSETTLHHQWLTDAILVEIKAHVKAITYIANRSGRSKGYFWSQIDELLGIAKQQMLPEVA